MTVAEQVMKITKNFDHRNREIVLAIYLNEVDMETMDDATLTAVRALAETPLSGHRIVETLYLLAEHLRRSRPQAREEPEPQPRTSAAARGLLSIER